MKIELQQAEVAAGIATYLTANGLKADASQLTISFQTTRKGDGGIVAFVEVPELAVASLVGTKAPVATEPQVAEVAEKPKKAEKKVVNTEAAAGLAAAVAESKASEEAVPVEVATEEPDPVTEVEAKKEEPAAEQAAPASTGGSLFS
ncbi:hypothetical protein [Pseudomonas phage vB_PaeP_4029]|uniref:Uncharacterized protein n=3 Tax=Litunavirus Ab09 TaxID=1920765 RepID=A0A2K8HW81_9CAUD|nr:hypothetical protein BI066_gp57 [Pseudomonas phage PEV2]AIZ94816.1 hypothetical protein [Pseudomonas phage RWG]ASZ72115.1 hypothetical protein vBPaePPYO2_00066 [Pseudomonas phage vB_PaeP_PYO2]ASZ72273.1 hypothetical protein vBPaePDEV_00066 [Pseudomonas phage vB_PaeP_DEV]UNY40772.1 hypothetical protein [Pseudomonas phage CMS1]UYE96397.1 hypothetical protein [Pseudomonas phage vB_PaeP_4029]UYE96576.1 hypothetical protein [Pseudomonas phage vB_PaeP_4032]UYE96663.1 hypothetical protein [Pseud